MARAHVLFFAFSVAGFGRGWNSVAFCCLALIFGGSSNVPNLLHFAHGSAAMTVYSAK